MKNKRIISFSSILFLLTGVSCEKKENPPSFTYSMSALSTAIERCYATTSNEISYAVLSSDALKENQIPQQSAPQNPLYSIKVNHIAAFDIEGSYSNVITKYCGDEVTYEVVLIDYTPVYKSFITREDRFTYQYVEGKKSSYLLVRGSYQKCFFNFCTDYHSQKDSENNLLSQTYDFDLFTYSYGLTKQKVFSYPSGNSTKSKEKTSIQIDFIKKEPKSFSLIEEKNKTYSYHIYPNISQDVAYEYLVTDLVFPSWYINAKAE